MWCVCVHVPLARRASALSNAARCCRASCLPVSAVVFKQDSTCLNTVFAMSASTVAAPFGTCLPQTTNRYIYILMCVCESSNPKKKQKKKTKKPHTDQRYTHTLLHHAPQHKRHVHLLLLLLVLFRFFLFFFFFFIDHVQNKLVKHVRITFQPTNQVGNMRGLVADCIATSIIHTEPSRPFLNVFNIKKSSH